jgi:hypothetical protein
VCRIILKDEGGAHYVGGRHRIGSWVRMPDDYTRPAYANASAGKPVFAMLLLVNCATRQAAARATTQASTTRAAGGLKLAE